jgi:hypothetical protein
MLDVFQQGPEKCLRNGYGKAGGTVFQLRSFREERWRDIIMRSQVIWTMFVRSMERKEACRAWTNRPLGELEHC